MFEPFDIRSGPIYRGAKPVRDRAYLAFLRKLCCVACGSYRLVEAAHFGAHGLSQKASDLDALPLCLSCHRTGPKAYHKLGARRFVAIHKLDVKAHQNRLQEFYRERMAA